jgi:site-specific DNA recombinase
MSAANKFTGGGVPYGYIVEGGALALDVDKAGVVREIYENRAIGNSLKQIADMLNEQGVKSMRGGDWTKQSVSYILSNRVYIGEYAHRGTAYEIPQIVSEQLFDEINTAKASSVQEQEDDSPFFWDSGLIFDL